MKVLVPATYDKDAKPGSRYTWHWVDYKWWKLSHFKAFFVYGAFKVG